MEADPRLAPQDHFEALATQARSLAEKLERVAQGALAPDASIQHSSFCGADNDGEHDLATLARNYLKARRLREALFPAGLFCDPAWDLLLDLFASQIEAKRVCVSDASIAANVPQTTGLRWLDMLGRQGLTVRRRDPGDGRRCFIELTPRAREAVAAWLRTAFPAPVPEPLPMVVRKVRHGPEALVTAAGAAAQF